MAAATWGGSLASVDSQPKSLRQTTRPTAIPGGGAQHSCRGPPQTWVSARPHAIGPAFQLQKAGGLHAHMDGEGRVGSWAQAHPLLPLAGGTGSSGETGS